MTDLEEMRKNVTEEEVQYTMKVLREEREKKAAKKARKEKKKKEKPVLEETLA